MAKEKFEMAEEGTGSTNYKLKLLPEENHYQAWIHTAFHHLTEISQIF